MIEASKGQAKAKDLQDDEVLAFLKEHPAVWAMLKVGLYRYAGFQARAFERIFAAYGAEEQSGTIVSASTGAGKTKAFYIPAFTAMAAELDAKAAPFTKVVAV